MIFLILRSFTAIIAGLAVAIAIFMAVEVVGVIFHPFPPGFSMWMAGGGVKSGLR